MRNCRKFRLPALAAAVLLIALENSGASADAVSSKMPHRIVSLAPSVTETVFALGYGNRLVGVTTHCDYPADARKIAPIGGFLNPSVEAVIARRPDLVIGVTSATDPMKAREMERLGLKLKLISLASVSEILASIRTIGHLLGDAPAGATLADRIALQLRVIQRSVAPAPRRRSRRAVGLRPLVAVGGKNFIDELITAAGGDNIAAEAAQPWLNLPDEYIVAKAPEVIIEAGTGADRDAAAQRWSDLQSIPAVRQRRVYSYPSDKILRPGPRIGEGAGEIARMVHPECFANAARGAAKENGCDRPRP